MAGWQQEKQFVTLFGLTGNDGKTTSKEWTDLEWNIILRKTDNRQEWRKLVVKSTVVPDGQPDYGIGEGEGLTCPSHSPL